MTGRLFKIGVPAALLALVVTALAADTPEKMAEKIRERRIARYVPRNTGESRFNVPVADGRMTPEAQARLNSRSVSILDDSPKGPIGMGVRGASSSAVPVVTPIIVCTGTSYDFMANDDGQDQVVTLGSGKLTHFSWTHWDVIPDSLDAIDRFVNYTAFSTTAGLTLGTCGETTSGDGGTPLKARAGFVSLDVATGDLAAKAYHQRNAASQLNAGPYGSWVLDQGLPGLNLFAEKELPGSRDKEGIWPHIQVDQHTGGNPDLDVFHVCSHPTGDYGGFNDQIMYWRRVGLDNNTWQGPVVLDVDAGTLNHHVATDATSDKLAIIYQLDDAEPNALLQMVYLECTDNGAEWGTEGATAFPTPVTDVPTITNDVLVYVTNYLDPNGSQAWLEGCGEYDNSGNLHLVWIEQIFANVSGDSRVKHWDKNSGNTRTIAQALDFQHTGGDGGRNLWLSEPQIGFGDGNTLCTDGPNNPGPAGTKSNLDYVYVTWAQAGGETLIEENDKSDPDNFQNLEVYLGTSNDDGNTWSPPINLTNTKTPGCDGTPGDTCASERDPHIAPLINDTIHISYIHDIDAGDAVFGQGTWRFNPYVYMRIPGGTDADYVCPVIAPSFAAQLTNADPDCEYNARFSPPTMVNETLRIENLGNAALTGTVSEVPNVDWLSVTGGGYTVNAGAAANTRTVTMNAGAASIQGGGEGLYQTTIEVSHNDVTKINPRVFDVDFFVFNAFFCPEEVTLNTGWLWLEVSNVGNVTGTNDDRAGLARLATDSSWSIYDGSFLIAHPPVGNDSIVYRNFSSGEGLSDPGFRAMSHLVVDTSAYGTGAGYATAASSMTTSDTLPSSPADSAICVDVTYIFPQDPDSCEFVLIKFKVYNRTASPINDLIVGWGADFDVTPGPTPLRGVQSGSENKGYVTQWSAYNMVYQQGADTANHVIVGTGTATRFKGGITAIQCTPAPRAWIGANDPWLFDRPGGYFHPGYLYDEMTKSGAEILDPPGLDEREDIHSVVVAEQNVDLGANTVKHYLIGLVSSNTGNDNPTDLVTTTKKAWKFCFGWQEFVDLDTLPINTPASYPYVALGTHENGIAGGCCGCNITELSDPGNKFSFTGPTGDPCTGNINFAGNSSACGSPFTASYRLRDLCNQYTDICIISVVVTGTCTCTCPFQGDIDATGAIDAVDLAAIIDVVFFGAFDPQDAGCPTTRSDFDNTGAPDAVDMAALIDHVFFGGPGPSDPCAK